MFGRACHNAAMKVTSRAELLRQIPSVDEVVRASSELVETYGRVAVTDAARRVLSGVRDAISCGFLDRAEEVERSLAGLDESIKAEVEGLLSYSLRPVINATGVILHTNLGRAPLATTALERIAEVAGVYSNLEFDVSSGERGKRDVHADRLFRQLLAAEGRDISTVVVNNNAAAVLLALNSLAEGGEVIVSRGELVEIGGSFRIPDVMGKSGTVLREVGTTNRTRISDYEGAINERTRLLLRVHRSNFEIVGFTEQPSLEELVRLGRERGIPVMEDLGSGALFDLSMVGVQNEPGVRESLDAGVDVVTYSGDKLLGGPQAGLISGRKELVAKIRSNPLFRALRVDKLTYAALEATLLAYIKQDYDAIPALRMMRLSVAEIERRARALIENLADTRLTLEMVDGASVIGGGSAPGATLPTKLIALTSAHLGADEIARRQRAANPPIVARVEEGRVLIDLRTVMPEQDAVITAALRVIAA